MVPIRAVCRVRYRFRFIYITTTRLGYTYDDFGGDTRIIVVVARACHISLLIYNISLRCSPVRPPVFVPRSRRPRALFLFRFGFNVRKIR